METNLYEQDYYLWLEKTISLLENRQFSELDLENLIDEIKDMSRRERQKLESLLTSDVLFWTYLLFRQLNFLNPTQKTGDFPI